MGLTSWGGVRLGEEATRGYLYAWLFVGIPVGASIVVNLLLAPSPRRLAERAVARRLTLAAAMLRVPDERTRRRFGECLREGVVEIQTLLDLAQRERTALATDIAALRRAGYSIFILMSAIDVTDRNPDAPLPDRLRGYLSETLDEMARILTTGCYPVEIAWESPDDEPLLFPLAEKVRLEIRDAIVHFTAMPEPGRSS